jgi:D-glycero-D-manno-heptose 1,7-bisphosphate phosphatase
VVTNQSGVARGYFSEDDVHALGRYITERLARAGVTLSGFYYCPHYPDGTIERYAVACRCRKPEPGLILDVARKHNLQLSQSWYVGDAVTDVIAGRRAGCRTVLVTKSADSFSPSPAPDLVARDLAEAATKINRAIHA